MMYRTKSSAGFTLVEMLVVIGIVSTLLVLVLNAKPKAAVIRLAITAKAVGASLQLARAQAMRSNAETVFRVDTSRLLFGVSNATHSFPKGMTVALTIAEPERAADVGGVRFFPDGQSSGGEIALMLDGHSSRIAVNWLTGEPQLGQ